MLLLSAGIFGAANAIGFGISAVTGSHIHLDLIGTGVFAVAAIATRGAGEFRQLTSAGCITLWATKLSCFLFYRVLHTQHDARLDTLLSTTRGAFAFWLISACWGFVVSLPHVLAAGVPTAYRPRCGKRSDLVGIGLFAAGLLLETLADYTKWAFKHNVVNRGRFCDVGVWQLSQHPNWLGNLLAWTGIFLLNAPTLLATGPSGGWGRGLLRLLGGACSPLFLLALFYGQATDRVGGQQALADAKYGSVPGYQAWLDSTPLVIPSAASIARTFATGRD